MIDRAAIGQEDVVVVARRDPQDRVRGREGRLDAKGGRGPASGLPEAR